MLFAPLIMLALAADLAPPRTPAPDWVVPEAIPSAPAATADAGAPDAGVEGPVAWLLSDTQVRAAPKSLTTFTHFAWRVRTRAGIDEIASRTFSYDPTSETVAIHGVWIVRDGKRIDAYFPGDAHVYARESRLEDRIYDGRMTLSLELRDVRVGDVVELQYSLSSTSDVFGGRYWEIVDQRFSVAVERVAWRLLWERTTPIAMRASSGGVLPKTQKRGSTTELVWQADRVAPLTVEGGLPSDVDPWPTIELSEWASWEEVATWATRLFVVNEKKSPLLRAEIDRLSKLPSLDARVQEAVRFAQDDLRYLGFELGPNSYRPHAPDWVLERRFGDCKDKSLLLVALLRGLGLDAWPALVNTSRGLALADQLPSPLHFNHAIVLARVEGREVWVDPTIALQRGPLAQRAPLEYRRALVVRPGTRSLSDIPDDALPAPDLEVEQQWRWPQRGAPATLTVTTRALGLQADALRSVLAEATGDDFAKQRLEFRQRLDAKLSQTEPPSWSDDADANVLTVTEKYTLPEFLDGEARHIFEPVSLNARVDDPPTDEKRAWPLALHYPLHVRERIVFDGPDPIGELDTSPRRASLPGLEASLDVKQTGTHMEMEYRARSTADRVEPADFSKYAQGRRDMYEWAAFHVYLPVVRPHADDTVGTSVACGLCSLAVLFFGGLALWERKTHAGVSFRQWRRNRRFRGLFQVAAGDAPATAIAVDAGADVGAFLPVKCLKGHLFSGPLSQEHDLVLAGVRITPWSKTCPECGAVERRYFRPR